MGGGDSVTLVEGPSGLDNWNRIGDSNWRTEGGAMVADQGKGGYLMSKNAYSDFEIRAEFTRKRTLRKAAEDRKS